MHITLFCIPKFRENRRREDHTVALYINELTFM